MDSYRFNLKTSPLIIKFPSTKEEEEKKHQIDESKMSKAELFSLDDDLKKQNPQKSLTNLSDNLKLNIDNTSSKKRLSEPVSFRVGKKQRTSLTTHLSKLSDKKLDIVHGGDESESSYKSKSPPVMKLSNFGSNDLLDIGNDKGVKHGYEPTHSQNLSTGDMNSDSPNKKTKKPACPFAFHNSPLKKIMEKVTISSNVNILSTDFDLNCNPETSKTNDTKLPLIMQSSNLVSDNVLDVGHDGGRIKTSTQVAPKKQESCESLPKQEIIQYVTIKNQVAKDVESLNVDSGAFEEEKSFNVQLNSNDGYVLNHPSQDDSKEFALEMPQKNDEALSESKKSTFDPKFNSDDISSIFKESEIKIEYCLESFQIDTAVSNTENQSEPAAISPPVSCDNEFSAILQSSDKCMDSLCDESSVKKEQIDQDLNFDSCDKDNLASPEKKESEVFGEQSELPVFESPISEDEETDKLTKLSECLESDKTSNQKESIQESQNDDSSSNQLDSQANDEPSMVFDILDEFERNENDPEEMDSPRERSDSDISDEEIDAMLEAGLGDYTKQGENETNLDHEEKEKVILKVRGRDHFDVLPEGWIEVTHNSGMPIYLHKQSRVCCVSKPYFLGPGSTRKHEIPLSAIPCLHYLKQLEREKEEVEEEKRMQSDAESQNLNSENGEAEKNCSKENSSNNEKSGATPNGSVAQSDANKVPKMPNGIVFPSAKLQSVKDLKLEGSLDYLAVREYCKKRFEFQTITVKRFKTWSGRRHHQKQIKRKQRPFLPDSTKLITCPLPSSADKSTTVGNVSKREFIMNPTGKSPVCILHEYVQHTLRVQPKYIFKELESASTPYGAVVIINDMEYGTGYGSSKKVAKSEAAKAALEVLIPKIKKFAQNSKNSDEEDELQDVEFFDQVRVEDPRVCDLSVKAGQPYPYQILLECLKRNYGMGDTEISSQMHNLKHQKNEFLMTVGKHSAKVICKNKRDGKQRASQSILQQLHPHINSWGSLLRMYGKGSCKTLKEKKEEEQRITELQTKACANKPNMSILNKLKEEMLKYREKMKSKKPIGKLIPERMQLLSVSDSNLKNIEL